MKKIKLDTPQLEQITLETERYYTLPGSDLKRYSVTTILKQTSQTVFSKSPKLDAAIARGNQFHAAIENLLVLPEHERRKYGKETLNGIIPDIWRHLEGIVLSIEPVLIEQYVLYSKDGLNYAGAVDSVVEEPNGKYTLIDWKTAGFKKPASQLKDYKCQLGAYTQALRQLGVPIAKAQLVIAHPAGVQEVILKDDKLEKEIEKFNKRLKLFYDIKEMENQIEDFHREVKI